MGDAVVYQMASVCRPASRAHSRRWCAAGCGLLDKFEAERVEKLLKKLLLIGGEVAACFLLQQTKQVYQVPGLV